MGSQETLSRAKHHEGKLVRNERSKLCSNVHSVAGDGGRIVNAFGRNACYGGLYLMRFRHLCAHFFQRKISGGQK